MTIGIITFSTLMTLSVFLVIFFDLALTKIIDIQIKKENIYSMIDSNEDAITLKENDIVMLTSSKDEFLGSFSILSKKEKCDMFELDDKLFYIQKITLFDGYAKIEGKATLVFRNYGLFTHVLSKYISFDDDEGNTKYWYMSYEILGKENEEN